LIGGFAVMELSDLDEAIALCRSCAKICRGTLEIDLRVVDQDEDPARPLDPGSFALDAGREIR